MLSDEYTPFIPVQMSRCLHDRPSQTVNMDNKLRGFVMMIVVSLVVVYIVNMGTPTFHRPPPRLLFSNTSHQHLLHHAATQDSSPDDSINTNISNRNLSENSLGIQDRIPLPVSKLITNTTASPVVDLKFPYEDSNLENVKSTPKDLFREHKHTNKMIPENPPLKKILFWNDAYRNKHFGFGFGQEPFLQAGCPVNTCTTTGNRSLYPLEELDAVVWHFRAKDKSLPRKRSPHTRYVFWMMESASHLYGSLQPYKNVFNWTFTYRLDSDFPNPYGRVYRRRVPLKAIHRNFAANKTKMAAWFVSNCHTLSSRETLVKTLKKWIKVEQYGQCGPLRCERSEYKKCMTMLEKDFKFYFSFENSLCRDYATEKFFDKLSLDVVPVVYGQGPYTDLAPEGSYIDALSFPSAKALADYLIYLDKNDTAYNEYFNWRRYYRTHRNWSRVAKPYCDMCARLHNDNTTTVYDLYQWFVKDSHCRTSSDPKIRRFINGYTKEKNTLLIKIMLGVGLLVLCASCLAVMMFVTTPAYLTSLSP